MILLLFPDRLAAGLKTLDLSTVVRIHLWEFFRVFYLNLCILTFIAKTVKKAGFAYFKIIQKDDGTTRLAYQICKA